MRQLKSQRDWAEMLAEDNAALFMFVDWSAYARRGREIFEEAEARFATTLSRPITWWVADASSITSPQSPALHRWLDAQDQKGKVHLFPNVGMGNGSVVWMKRGEVVGFDPSVQLSGVEALVRRTREVLAEA